MDLNASLKVKTMKKGQIRKVYRGWLRWDFHRLSGGLFVGC